MSVERGQALVESVAALPVLVASAMLLVDAGIIMRDRVAVSQAATRAAEATLVGANPDRAARAALPQSLRARAVVTTDGPVTSVAVRSRATSPHLVGRTLRLTSQARTDAAEVTR